MSWKTFFADSIVRERLKTILIQVEKDRVSGPVYPAEEDVLRFTLTPIDDVRVVILGQDPYHQPSQAHGLAFSVPSNVKAPPSLRNILKELESDLGLPPPTSGDLTPWTQQGVLLLNTALTVKHGNAGSHLDLWRPFTDLVVRHVMECTAVIPHFILWGSPAYDTFKRNSPSLEERAIGEGVFRCSNATFSRSVHPSPLSASRGFFGSKPFSKANYALAMTSSRKDDQGIDWRLP